MSGFPDQDKLRSSREVRLLPAAEGATLSNFPSASNARDPQSISFNHFSKPGHKRGNFKVKTLCGFCVDEQLELCNLLHR
jgi:hypothetical protein